MDPKGDIAASAARSITLATADHDLTLCRFFGAAGAVIAAIDRSEEVIAWAEELEATASWRGRP